MYSDQRGDDGSEPGRRRQQDGRHGRDDRADDRQQLEDPGDHRQQDRVPPEHRIDVLAEDRQPDEREDADREAEDELRPDPLAERAGRMIRMTAQTSKRQVAGRDCDRTVAASVARP